LFNPFIFLKQFQRNNSCENQGTVQGNEYNTEITDRKIMALAYEQYGVPVVSCSFIHFPCVVISYFSVLCVGSSCCREGSLQQSYLQQV
jgi:hypothetical protein